LPRKKKEEIIEDEILDKIEYLGLNLDKIPNSIQDIRPLEYRVPRIYDEKKYRHINIYLLKTFKSYYHQPID